MMVYKGEATDMSKMTQEEVQDVMAKWAVWIQEVGPALVDVGTPFGPGFSLVDDGTSGTAIPLNGYSIVEARNAETAKALAAGHPYLVEGKGDYAIDIYEMMPVPIEG
jgi:hypothetical protein